MFFSLFGLFFSNFPFLRSQNSISPSIQYPNNLIFSVVVCICKIYLFHGGNCLSSHIKYLDHVTLISQIYLKFSSVVGVIEIWKLWKYWPLTPSISQFMIFFKNDKLVCLEWHFKYYFFFENFCFKQSPVLKIHWGTFFDSRNSKLTSIFF